MNCYQNGVLTASYRCSDFGYGTGPQTNVTATCSYTFCDNNAVCPGPSVQYAQKTRTKYFYLESGGSCYDSRSLYKVRDDPAGCCYCRWSPQPVTPTPD